MLAVSVTVVGMGCSSGLARPDYQRPPRTLTSVFYNIEFECVSPSDRGSHFSLGASSSGLRSLAVAWDAGSRPSVASARGPTAGGHGDSPLKPSSPGRNVEAAPQARLIVFRCAMDHLGANVMERSG